MKALHHEKSRLQQQGLGSRGQITSSAEFAMGDLNDRIRMLTEENDSLLERLHLVGNDYSKLQEENADIKQQLSELSNEYKDTANSLSESKYLNDNVLEMKMAYDQEMENLNRELTLLQEDNSRLREDVDRLRQTLDSSNAQLLESKKTTLELTVAYKNGIKDIERFSSKENAMLDELKHLTLQSDEYSNLYNQCSYELEIMQRERADMIATMRKMEQQLVDYEDRVVSYQQKLSTAVDNEDQGRLEIDRLKMREEVLLKDVKRFEDRVQQLNDRQLEFVNMEVEKHRHHFEAEKRKIMEEWQQAMFEKSEMQMQAERAIREKRIAETEAQKIRDYVPVELERLQGTLEEYQVRIRRAENEKNDSQHELENVKLKLSREQNRFESDKHLLCDEMNVLQQRIRTLEGDIERAKDERLNLYNALQESKHQNDTDLKTAETAQNELKKQLEQATRKHEYERKETDRQHQQDVAVVEKLSKEIQDLLSQQQKMAIKWKDESKAGAKNFERITEELQSRLAKAEERLSEATQRYVHLNAIKDETMKQLEELKKAHRNIQSVLNNAENRASGNSQQVKILLAREQDLMNETRVLQRTVDQLTLENKRIQRQNKSADKRFSIGLPELRKSVSEISNTDRKLAALGSFDAVAESVDHSEITLTSLDALMSM